MRLLVWLSLGVLHAWIFQRWFCDCFSFSFVLGWNSHKNLLATGFASTPQTTSWCPGLRDAPSCPYPAQLPSYSARPGPPTALVREFRSPWVLSHGRQTYRKVDALWALRDWRAGTIMTVFAMQMKPDGRMTASHADHKLFSLQL